MTGNEREALREWELRVCPDCGNHLTAFSLCEHQKGGDGPTGIDFDKFTFVRVLEAEPVERELERLRAALAAREEATDDSETPLTGRQRDLIALRSIRAREDTERQDGEQEFIAAADWLVRCLKDVVEGKVVRGLPEAEGAYHRTRAALVARDTEV